MPYKSTLFGFCALLLAACNATKPVPEPEITIDSGASIQVEEVEEIQEIQEPDLTTAETLQLLYTEAIAVYDHVVAFSSTLDPQEQEALSEAIAAFSADIETLKYYSEVADREPLLDDDHVILISLTKNIEDAIELFAHVMDMLQ